MLTGGNQEFGLGFYDGISGLVTQPFKGAKQDGPAGFFKGLYKGLGGVVLKPGAGKITSPTTVRRCGTDLTTHSHLGHPRIYLPGHLQGDSEALRLKRTQLHLRGSHRARV